MHVRLLNIPNRLTGSFAQAVHRIEKATGLTAVEWDAERGLLVLAPGSDRRAGG